MPKFIFILFIGAAMHSQVRDTAFVRAPLADSMAVKSDSTVMLRKTYAEIDPDYAYEYSKPTFWQIFKYVPQDLYQFGRFATRKQNLKWDLLTVGSTAAILPFDQQLLDGAGDIGRQLGGWDQDSHYKKVGGILNIIPQNISSGVYYIGNGGTTVLLSGVFYGIGKINNDYRALNTSNELLECLLSVGIATQTIKRITGRQSPNRALQSGHPGGDWQPFPGFVEFQKNTPNYDAMPSGHLATYVATVTIIAVNYPELKWVKPVGYGLGGILAFNMVSSKVHWVSDYPLGIFIGYVMGKTIAERRITKTPKQQPVGSIENRRYKLDYSMTNLNNTMVFGTTVNF